MSSFRPLDAYRETNIRTASQGKLIIMLYDEAIKQLELAGERLSRTNPRVDEVSNAIIRAQEMITELMVSLNFDQGGEIAKTLFSLYMFFNRQLMEANMRKEAGPVKQVADMMRDLRQAWAEVVQKERGGDSSPASGGVNIAG